MDAIAIAIATQLTISSAISKKLQLPAIDCDSNQIASSPGNNSFRAFRAPHPQNRVTRIAEKAYAADELRSAVLPSPSYA